MAAAAIWFETAWHMTTAKNGLSAKTPATNIRYELAYRMEDASPVSYCYGEK